MDAKESVVKEYFSAVDFVVFGCLLVAFAIIGIYFAWKDRNDSSTKNYYFGRSNMHPISVGLSLAVTSISAITVIGVPAEVYKVGTVWFWSPVAVALVAIFTIVYYIPLYRRLQLNMIFEYLELRFNPTIRRLAAILVTIHAIIYMGIAVYIPSLSLNAVTPIPITWSILLTSIICTFYTTLGGIKAVIWTDVLQSVIMVAGLVAVFIRGVIIIGGFQELGSALERGQRVTAFSADFDITSRMTPLSVFLGTYWIFSYTLAFSQTSLQRFKACQTTRHAKCSVYVYLLPGVAILSLSILCGLMMYAYFEDCDPIMSGKIQKMDQGIPYIVLEMFKDAPGVAGMFVAAIYSASLSTVSSGLNAFSVVSLEDFIVVKWPGLSGRKRLLIGKVTACMLGFLVMTMALAVSGMESDVVKTFSSLSGTIVGPVMGVFILGFFFPWTNSWGAICGTLLSCCFMVWILLGSMFLKTVTSTTVLPPVTIDMCHVNHTKNATYDVIDMVSTAGNMTSLGNLSDPGYTFDQVFYSISFHYYKFMEVLVTVVAGLLVSFITGANSAANVDPKLFIPLIDNAIFPTKVRKFFRFGVRELKGTRTKLAVDEGSQMILE